jgi:hypothetical protein
VQAVTITAMMELGNGGDATPISLTPCSVLLDNTRAEGEVPSDALLRWWTSPCLFTSSL